MRKKENVWAWSDPHFGHNNILKLCEKTRPFKDIEEMNEKLIESWNSTVGDDIIYLLGDFSFNNSISQSVFNRLSGEKHLILGNHDPHETRFLGWTSISNYKELRFDKERFVLFHYPMVEWNGFYRQSIHLYGHVHGAKVFGDDVHKKMDVGFDAGNSTPINLREVEKRLEGRKNDKPIC